MIHLMGTVLTAPKYFRVPKPEGDREAKLKLMTQLCSSSCWSKS